MSFPLNSNEAYIKDTGERSTLGKELAGAGSGSLPTASADVKGGVKIGSGLTMTGEVLSNNNPTPYSLPTASADTLGGVKVGSGLSILDGVLSAVGGGGGSSCHLYHGTCNNSSLKEFYILSSVNYDGTSVPLNQMRAILFGGVGFVVPHADATYNDAGRIPTFLTISSATAAKFTVITMDLAIDGSAVKYTKNIAEPEYSYIASQFSMTKIF